MKKTFAILNTHRTEVKFDNFVDPLKIINDEKWIDLIIDSPLLKYNVLLKEKEEEKKIIEDKKEEKPIELKCWIHLMIKYNH